MANDFRDADRRRLFIDPASSKAYGDYLAAMLDVVRVNPSDYASTDAPASVCEHPAALLVLADALATCDGCGRVFELRGFGK